MVSNRRLILGDVIEIPLSNGNLAYAQFVYNHKEKPVWGHLIRVLPGVFRTRPADFKELVKKEERFCAFFPAGAAVRRGVVKIASSEKIPQGKENLPLFRATNDLSKRGNKRWWLWDGKNSREIGVLTSEQSDFPLKEIVSLDVLVERIEKGWTPREEV